MKIFKDTDISFDEALAFLYDFAKKERKRNVDPFYKCHLERNQVHVNDSFSIVPIKQLPTGLQNIIETAKLSRSITELKNGSILLSSFIDLVGLKPKDALELVYPNRILLHRHENRGKKSSSSIPNYNTLRTVVLPPDEILDALLERKTVYHIATINSSKSLPKKISDELKIGSDEQLFDKIVAYETKKFKTFLGIW